jgi:3-deoxy-D-manno-octulosonate 8-phosphate phosphatase (KDO 8-P phosphatase)
MDRVVKNRISPREIAERAKRIKFVLTDVDGVLTDTGVYYSEAGEVMKLFSVRDGMGVQRLRDLFQIDTGIITGENSEAVKQRAKKLCISELHCHIKDKASALQEIAQRRKIPFHEMAFIGDDINDIEAMKLAGLSACPADAMADVQKTAHVICTNKGGQGAFREFAELIISAKRDP